MGDRLTGKTALITGASRGIGYAIAEAYAAEGAHLALNARERARLDAAADRLKSKYDTEIATFACDVTNRSKVEEMVNAVREIGVGSAGRRGGRATRPRLAHALRHSLQHLSPRSE